jgi:hypothetical protein
MEDRRHWYEAEVLLADLGSHRHSMRGARVEEIEARIRLLYPRALAVLVRSEDDGSGASVEGNPRRGRSRRG